MRPHLIFHFPFSFSIISMQDAFFSIGLELRVVDRWADVRLRVETRADHRRRRARREDDRGTRSQGSRPRSRGSWPCSALAGRSERALAYVRQMPDELVVARTRNGEFASSETAGIKPGEYHTGHEPVRSSARADRRRRGRSCASTSSPCRGWTRKPSTSERLPSCSPPFARLAAAIWRRCAS